MVSAAFDVGELGRFLLLKKVWAPVRGSPWNIVSSRISAYILLRRKTRWHIWERKQAENYRSEPRTKILCVHNIVTAGWPAAQVPLSIMISDVADSAEPVILEKIKNHEGGLG